MPEVHVAEALVEAFKKEGSVEHLKMLWVRAETTREVVGEELSKMGAILDEAIAYRTVKETEDISGARARFEEEGADLITFTSASTVDCFMDLELPIPKDLKVASIGPITTESVERNGLEVDIDAEVYSIPGLIDAILDSKELFGK